MRWLLLAAAMVLVVSVEAGTKKAPPKEPQAPLAPIDQLMAKIRQGDPKGLIVANILYGNTQDEVLIVVTNAFHRAHYQERLQMTQGFGAAWQSINRAPVSRVFVVDGRGNIVGRVGAGGYTWVQER